MQLTALHVYSSMNYEELETSTRKEWRCEIWRCEIGSLFKALVLQECVGL